jgi:signal transduction histidine kinase
MEAQRLIENQNEIINLNNQRLSEEVQYQTKSLVQTNKELAQHVSQLEQFAFIVSHNLRAPVARILGLGSVIKDTEDYTEIKKIAGHLKQSAQELDSIFHDLNLILQIKDLGNETLLPVYLSKTVQRVKNILQPEITKSNTTIVDTDIKANHLNTVPAYIESILYNLIANAIKYRDESRGLIIEISSEYKEDNLMIQVQDNGIGIDLAKHEANLFKPYKRFHKNGEGKGLGLFLVKTQTSFLGGEIFIESKVDTGTTFTILIKHNLTTDQTLATIG